MNKFTFKDSSGKIYFGWYIALMGIILMTFAYSCVVSVVGVFMLPVTQSLGLQIGDFSIWLTIMSLTAIIFLAIFSKMYSKKTIKPIMIVACILGVVGFIGFATSNSLTQFYVFSVPLGICFGGLTTTPSILLTSNWFGPSLRGKALGVVFGGNSIVVMFILPILNYAVQTLGWRNVYFALAGCLIVICLPLILKLTVWSPEEKGLQRMGDAEGQQQSSEIITGISFKDGLKKPATWLMFISGTLLVIASSSILLHSQPFMIMNGYSATFASSVVSIMIGICVITCMLVGAVNDRAGLKAASLFSGVFFVIAYVAQIYIPAAGIAMVILFIVGYGLGCPSVNIISPLFANHMFGEKEVGAFIGYINLFISVGGAFAEQSQGSFMILQGITTLRFGCAPLCLL